jgi:hypothetical protein
VILSRGEKIADQAIRGLGFAGVTALYTRVTQQGGGGESLPDALLDAADSDLVTA